jgi:hypothetical protein
MEQKVLSVGFHPEANSVTDQVIQKIPVLCFAKQFFFGGNVLVGNVPLEKVYEV